MSEMTPNRRRIAGILFLGAIFLFTFFSGIADFQPTEYCGSTTKTYTSPVSGTAKLVFATYMFFLVYKVFRRKPISPGQAAFVPVLFIIIILVSLFSGEELNGLCV